MNKRRRQIGLLVVLSVAAAVSLYYGFGASSGVSDGPGKAASGSVVLAEVEPIDLARADGLKEGTKTSSDLEDEGLGPDGASEPGGVPPRPAMPLPPPVTAIPPVSQASDGVAAPLAGPAPPPMNLRYLGAVQVPDGGWVAALLTDRKELLTGKEGEVVANRYRIVKIGIESIDLLETASGRQKRVKIGGAS